MESVIRQYVRLMAEHCVKCREGEQECTEMECKATHDVMESFFPYVEKMTIN